MDSDIERGEISEGIQPIETCINESEESFKRRDMSLLFGDEEGGGEDIMLIDEDLYNIEISVAITETETDEVNSELSDALSEIDGEKSFPCSSCDNMQIQNTQGHMEHPQLNLCFAKIQSLHL